MFAEVNFLAFRRYSKYWRASIINFGILAVGSKKFLLPAPAPEYLIRVLLRNLRGGGM